MFQVRFPEELVAVVLAAEAALLVAGQRGPGEGVGDGGDHAAVAAAAGRPPALLTAPLVPTHLARDVPPCTWGHLVELQTKVREDFTITDRIRPHDCENFADGSFAALVWTLPDTLRMCGMVLAGVCV